MGIKETGRSPDMHPCPRCGKRITAWWNGRRTEFARHKGRDGKPCREVHPPRPDGDLPRGKGRSR